MSKWRHFELDELPDAPLRIQLFLLVTLFLFLQIVGVVFILWPENAGIEAAEHQQTLLSTQVEVLKIKNQNLEQQEIAFAKQVHQLELEIKQLSAPHKLSTVLSEIDKLSRVHYLDVFRLEWGDKSEDEYFYRWPINIEVSGGYHDIGRFTQALNDVGYLFLPTTIHLKTLSENSNQLLLKTEAYIYQSKGSQLHDIEGLPQIKESRESIHSYSVIYFGAKFRDPFTPISGLADHEQIDEETCSGSVDGTKPGVFQEYEINQLKYKGVIRNGKGAAALMQAPSGAIAFVKQGRSLAAEQFMLREVHEDYIVMEGYLMQDDGCRQRVTTRLFIHDISVREGELPE